MPPPSVPPAFPNLGVHSTGDSFPSLAILTTPLTVTFFQKICNYDAIAVRPNEDTDPLFIVPAAQERYRRLRDERLRDEPRLCEFRGPDEDHGAPPVSRSEWDDIVKRSPPRDEIGSDPEYEDRHQGGSLNGTPFDRTLDSSDERRQSSRYAAGLSDDLNDGERESDVNSRSGDPEEGDRGYLCRSELNSDQDSQESCPSVSKGEFRAVPYVHRNFDNRRPISPHPHDSKTAPSETLHVQRVVPSIPYPKAQSIPAQMAPSSAHDVHPVSCIQGSQMAPLPQTRQPGSGPQNSAVVLSTSGALSSAPYEHKQGYQLAPASHALHMPHFHNENVVPYEHRGFISHHGTQVAPPSGLRAVAPGIPYLVPQSNVVVRAQQSVYALAAVCRMPGLTSVYGSGPLPTPNGWFDGSGLWQGMYAGRSPADEKHLAEDGGSGSGLTPRAVSARVEGVGDTESGECDDRYVYGCFLDSSISIHIGYFIL